MITLEKISAGVVLLLTLGSVGCGDEYIDGEIPPATFNDIHINLDLPQYSDLSFDGGYITISQGVRGIIVYRVNSSTYNAFERNCSYSPYDACATVEVHSSGLFLSDPCCRSTFSLVDGMPTGGPARLPLRRYQIIRSSRSLTITDQPVN